MEAFLLVLQNPVHERGLFVSCEIALQVPQGFVL